MHDSCGAITGWGMQVAYEPTDGSWQLGVGVDVGRHSTWVHCTGLQNQVFTLSMAQQRVLLRAQQPSDADDQSFRLGTHIQGTVLRGHLLLMRNVGLMRGLAWQPPSCSRQSGATISSSRSCVDSVWCLLVLQ